MPDIVSKLLLALIWGSCDVLFESEQTPFLGQVARADLDLLLLHRIHIVTQRPMNDSKMEQIEMALLGWQQLLANSIKNFISFEKKKWLVVAQNLQDNKNLLTLELSQYCKRHIFLLSRLCQQRLLLPCVCACQSAAQKSENHLCGVWILFKTQ